MLSNSLLLFPDNETVVVNDSRNLFSIENVKVVNSIVTEVTVNDDVEDFEINIFIKPILDIVSYSECNLEDCQFLIFL